MRAIKFIGIVLLTIISYTSCDLVTNKMGQQTNKEKEEKETTEKQTSYDYSSHESKRTVVKTFNVRAEIYKVVQEGTRFYEKATNHYCNIEITLYGDGTAYCTSIISDSSNLPLRVRDTINDDYNFECNNGQTVYKFNTDEMF